MTNSQFASTLEKMAVRYRENDKLPQVSLSAYLYEKDQLAAALRGFGGKWEKVIPSDNSDTLDFKSKDLPGLRLWIPRNKVCRKIVTFDCDPIMSPEEEAEVLA